MVGQITYCKSLIPQATSGFPGQTVCPPRPTPQGTRICVPPELFDCTLADLYGSHQGIDRMQAQAREAVYWPGIDAVDYVFQCNNMHQAQSLSPMQPMLPRDIPDGPWQEIPADYLIHKGKEYLLVCDLFIKYPFLYKVSTKSTQSLSMHLLELILQYGPPCMLHTNNGPHLLQISLQSSSSITA